MVSDIPFRVEIDPLTNRVSANKPMFGTNNQDSTGALVQQVFDVVRNAEGKRDLQTLKSSLAIIDGFNPKDVLEGVLAVQMMGVHTLAVECLQRAIREGQPSEVMDLNINRSTKLLRTFTAQMEALNRHRGKIGQQMVVGNVNVNQGGQAIVGSVNHDGRGKASSER